MLVVNENNRSNLDEVKKAIKRRNSAMDNYIMFEGKKIPLTEEQVVALKGDPQKNPFERRKHGEKYYYINGFSRVVGTKEFSIAGDDEHFAAGNYCTDYELMKQRAMHETLDRLLWRFSMENGEGGNPWDGVRRHYYIVYQMESQSFSVHYFYSTKGSTPYFDKEETAHRAIEEIVRPFMAEHPDFIW